MRVKQAILQLNQTVIGQDAQCHEAIQDHAVAPTRRQDENQAVPWIESEPHRVIRQRDAPGQGHAPVRTEDAPKSPTAAREVAPDPPRERIDATGPSPEHDRAPIHPRSNAVLPSPDRALIVQCQRRGNSSEMVLQRMVWSIRPLS